MRIVSIIAAAAALSTVTIAAVPASAKDVTIKRNINEGRQTRIWLHRSIRRSDCATKPPQFKILSRPGQGELSFAAGKGKLQIKKGALTKCDGKEGVWTNVFYKPKAGYTGADKAKYAVRFASGNVLNVTVELNVRKKDDKGWFKPK